MQDLEGVCALVTGGASEVGAEVIRELVERGASVLAADSTEERIDEAIARLGLDDPDEIFTHALEGADVVSWWDLANLIGSYFNTLNLFVHIAEPSGSVPVRTLGLDALREAQAASTDSFLTAMARLEKYLIEASAEDRVGACVVAVVPSADGDVGSVPGSMCHASTLELTNEMTRAYAEADLNIRVHAVRAGSADAKGAAKAIVDLVGH
jgi:NAD(P)-dependent dehydrogenase (short-subunit alcohol dehydrogenase family)